MKRPPFTPAELRQKARDGQKRKALRMLRRAKAAAEASPVDLTDWEGEFLGSVEERVQTFGRAFADPEKGAALSAFSVRQMRKLREIAAKVKGADDGGSRVGRPKGAAPPSE